ncbi:MAG: TolC family protein [Planctomycetota bacterium]|nr:TolC family protein [Planctomycetota bacterium]
MSPLTVDQAVTIALQNNRSMRATLEGIASARADLVQSGLLPNPVLSATFDTSIGGEGGSTAISVSLVQQLTDLWIRPARQDAAAATLREQILSVSDEALRLVADVRQSHAGLVYGQRGIALTGSHIELIDRAIEISESRIRAGEGTQLDVNRLRQLKFSLEADQTLQVLQIGKARRNLLELLGLAAADAEWEAADVSTHLMSDSVDFNEAEVIELASLQRLDVAAAHKTLETRLHELRVANLGSMPDLEAGPSYERDEEGRDALGAEINLEIPIFDTNEARVAKAKSDWRRAQALADQVLQSAVAQTRTAWLDVQTNMELISFFRDRVLILAKDNLRLAERAFQAGQIDMTVVLETQRELIQAEFELNELENIATDRMIELEYAVGGKLSRDSDTQLNEEDLESS